MKTITIGRGDGCQIFIDDDLISRRHAILKISTFGKMEIVDMGKNGTFVNGIRLRPNVPVPVKRKDIISFANYIAFFPTILSGPIDRPKPFLAQANEARPFNPDQLMTGFRRVLWGMFLKMCIADRLDIYVSAIWNNYEHHSAISILFASLLYPLQMYADFGGYSEMAIGVALMLGFKVAENFKRPFFVLDISCHLTSSSGIGASMAPSLRSC